MKKIRLFFRILAFINKFLFVFILIFSLVFYSLRHREVEIRNKIFQHHPLILFLILGFSFILLFVDFEKLFYPRKWSLRNLFRIKEPFLLDLAILFTIFCLFSFNIYHFFKQAMPLTKVLLNNPSASYDWKMTFSIGPFYDYMQFVCKFTPEKALILHPKQQSRWPEISNQGYTRYFVYPRDLVAENGDEEKKEKITHIFIVGRKTLDSKKSLDQWPEQKIPARRLIYVPEFPGGEVTLLEKDYDPTDKINDRWGIIELEKL